MSLDETFKFNVGQESIQQYNDRTSAVLAARNPTPPAAPPINRTVYDNNGTTAAGTSAADQYLDTFRAPESAEQIAERKRRQSQGLIDNLNKTFDDEVARKKQVGQERLNMDNALSVITGNTGGSEAIGSRTKVLDANDKELQAVNNQRALELSKVYTAISSEADAEARQQLQDATLNAEQVVARREQAQSKAVENLKLMAAGGLVDFDAFASAPENSKVYKYALDSVGGSEQSLRALFMLNRPQDQLVGEPVRMGTKYVQAYKNPITGKVKYEQLDLPFDLPQEYSSFQKMGNNLVAIPDNWDGDTSKLKTVYTETPSAGKRDTQVVKTEDGRSILIDSQTGEEIKSYGAGSTEAQTKANSLVDRAITAIGDLRGTPGQGGAIGAGFQKTLLGRDTPVAGSNAADFLTKLDQVKALLAFPDLGNMKGLGPMSEREFNAVQAAAGALSKDMSESQFNAELARIEARLNNIKLAGQLQAGEMLVRDRATGQVGAIPENEFNAEQYEPI